MTTTYASVNRLPWCCGVLEAGSFRSDIMRESGGQDRCGETPEKLLARILENAEGCPVMFNFYREIEYYRDSDGVVEHEDKEYQAADLREEVMKHPQAQNLVTFVNPNSGNRVDSWMIFTGEIPYGYED